jgi:polysaccharide deacetylase family protein (PEP-CTERM system associated)
MRQVSECIFSVDVEDWFHILDLPSTPDVTLWDHLPSRVEKNFTLLLDIFSEHRVRVTCFFLGWVASKFPHLVLEAARRGHEIASHGLLHHLVDKMPRPQFVEDAKRSKEILESIIGGPVFGYRCSGFSVTRNTPWFFEALLEAGYQYDSSVFPAVRGHGGFRNGHLAPYWVGPRAQGLAEFPISVKKLFGAPVCFFGGGYLRLFPFFVIRRMARNVLRESRPTIFYVHPREIDFDHPRLSMNFYRHFKSYVNLKTTNMKIHHVLEEFKIVTFKTFLENHAEEMMTVDPLSGALLETVPTAPVERLKAECGWQ